MMNIHRLALSLCFAACAPSFTVVRQATPNPLAAGTTLAVEPITFEGLTLEGMTEKAYLGRYAARAELRTYQTDKAEMDALFRAQVTKSLGVLINPKASVRVRARIVSLTPGADGQVATVAGNTTARFAVYLTGEDGTDLDEITIELGTAGDGVNTASDRMRGLGEKLADAVVGYLKQRAAL